MFRGPTKLGFDVPASDARTSFGNLPALIATLSLGLSIAVVLTVVSVTAARAAHLF
jgi:hypothetical protein